MSSITCSSSLSCLAGAKDRRSSPPPLIRVSSDSESSELSGPTVVDYSPERSQWETDFDGSPRSGNRIRCIQHGMGSSLQQLHNERSVVGFRDFLAYQCEGNVSSFSGFADICQGQSSEPCTSEDRQCYSRLLHQSPGRNTLPYSDAAYFRNVELVHAEKDFPVSRASIRQAESHSRLRIKSIGRQFGVETQSERISAGDVISGSMSNRLIYLKAYCSAPNVHELEARSGISGNGCSESKLGNKKMLCFSSFFPDREVFSKSEAGEGSRISTDCTCMANTTVVPGADVNDTSTAITSAKHNNIADESEQRGSFSTTPGIVETSRMACIRSSLQSQ